MKSFSYIHWKAGGGVVRRIIFHRPFGLLNFSQKRFPKIESWRWAFIRCLSQPNEYLRGINFNEKGAFRYLPNRTNLLVRINCPFEALKLPFILKTFSFHFRSTKRPLENFETIPFTSETFIFTKADLDFLLISSGLKSKILMFPPFRR